VNRFAYILCWVILITPSIPILAQELSLEEFVSMVMTNHPIAQQSSLLDQQAQRVLQKAKGSFDPNLYSSYDQKQYNDVNYYQRFDGGIMIPTWYGITVKSGYERALGVYLNPEEILPEAGLWFAGISVPLARGLVMDQRRTALKQAKIYAESTEQERRVLLNNLLYDAKLTYLNWVQTAALKNIADAVTIVAERRLEGVKQRIEQGDAPAIDSIDARAQIINFKLQQTQARLSYKKQLLELSNFLWTKELIPLEASDLMQPATVSGFIINDPYNADSIVNLVEGLATAHPDIILYQYRLAHLEVERKNKMEQLKPRLDINYNFLNESFGELGAYSFNDFKIGIQFEMPIFARRERAEVKLNVIRQLDTEYAAQQKLLELQNKLRQHAIAKEYLSTQREQMAKMVMAYTTLLNGEQARFDVGESSVFTVNLRESKLLNAQVKQVDIAMEYYRELIHLEWVAAML